MPFTRKLLVADDLEESQSKGIDLGEEGFFAVKKDNEIFVYRNKCPHLGLPLEWLEDQFLDSEGELIQCASHGALFTIDQGKCVAGPCQGQSLSAVEFEVRDGEVFIAD